MRCPLCAAAESRLLAAAHGRDYHRCSACELTFMDPAHRLDAARERARYDTHNNDPADARYREFLDRLAGPLTARLRAGAEGLDYGSGPGPTLPIMMAERGFAMALWDPFYASDPAPLQRPWDFITCTEVIEHFFDPAAEFARLDSLLRPAGVLAVMTELLHDDVVLASWYYARDPTHVCFYRPRTLDWLASRYGWRLERPSRTVAFFIKPEAVTGSRSSPR